MWKQQISGMYKLKEKYQYPNSAFITCFMFLYFNKQKLNEEYINQAYQYNNIPKATASTNSKNALLCFFGNRKMRNFS